MNALTAVRTSVIEEPIEFDSSTSSVIGPPQRLRASTNEGAPWTLLAGIDPRVVPPAVMLIWLMPPPEPAESPPPLIVTTTRLAFLTSAPVANWVSVTASGASGWLTMMTQVGRVQATVPSGVQLAAPLATPGIHGSPA